MCNQFNKKFLDEAALRAEQMREDESPQEDQSFMEIAVELAEKGVGSGEGGPFGCVIVKDGLVIGRGNNKVTSSHDPTAHAEIVAIRAACAHLGTHQLEDCDLYTSCEPCPMCLGAIYWSRPRRIFYACTKQDAAHYGFDDDFIYQELPLPVDQRKIEMRQVSRTRALKAFELWEKKEDKELY